MKCIVINASPRKSWNTAEIMQSAQKGAESVGAETEYINLYDIDFKGCRSCLVCKLKGKEKCKCYWRDNLSPLIENPKSRYFTYWFSNILWTSHK